jgi:fatty acid desaturase
MQASSDRRQTTHHVRQSWLARFWIVPFNTGWHLAHHVDMGVPWRNLPALHRELEQSGWVPDHLVYPSYPALWRALSSQESQTQE